MSPTPPGSPPNPPDLSAQVEATKQLAAAMALLTQQLAKANKGIRDQTEVSTEHLDVLDDISKQRDEEEKKAEERLKQLNEEIKGIRSLSNFTALLNKEWEKAAKNSTKLAVGLAAVTGAAKGFKAGISLMNNVLSGLGGILSTIIGTIFDLGVAILTGPIKMFNALFSKAKQAMSGSTELATALEKIRENFGDIGSGLGGIVAGMGKSLTQGVIVPGLSAMRVFGNVAEATAYANEMASLAPAAFQKLSAQFKDSAKEALAMAKGLGISKEEFAGLMNAAVSSGRDVVEIETEITKYAKGMAKEFNLDSKMISRDMGRAMKDVKHFANVSVKELAKATTYAHGLGLELKDITGVLDAFNTFESAAESVSKLSQAFGVNLDTMKLLEAETPDQALDQIKQAFAAAGKSADQMSRRELQLIAQSVNLDEATVRQALSTKNAGISMDRAKAASAGLEGQTMSTAQAMQALSKDIERVVKAGEPPKGENFFEVFFEGVMEGMERTATFRNLMMNLMKSIHVVRQAGRDLGMQLMEVIPGLKQMLGGLSDMVSPDKIGGLFRAFSKSFVEFFQILKTGGSVTIRDLVQNLKKNFLDYLTAAGPGGQSFLSGLSDLWTAAKKIIASAIDYIGDMLSSGLNSLTDMLSGKFNDQASAVGNAIMGEVSPITDAFGRMFEKLKEPLAKLGEQALGFIGNTIGKYLEENWTKILGTYLSFAFIGAFATAFAQATGTAIMQAVIVPFLQKLAAQILGAAALNRATQAAASSAAGGAAAPFSLSAGSFAMMAFFIVAALAAVGLSIAVMREYDVTTEEVIKAGIAVTAAGILMVTAGMAASSMAAVGAQAPALLSAIAGAAVMVPIVGGMMLMAWGILALAEKYKTITLANIMNILPVLGVTALLIAEAALIAGALMAVGGAVTASGGTLAIAMAAGLLALGLIITAMIVTAGEIMSRLATQNFDPAKVNAAVGVVEVVGNLFIKTIPIMAAVVAAIGVAAFGPLAVAGFNVLTNIVDKIVDTSIDVIKRINKIDVGDASILKTKIEPFISIMKSIVEMINAIGGVLQSTGAGAINGIISSWTGKSPFDGAAILIDGLVGNESEGRGIIGVIKVIKDSMEKLQSVPTATVAAFGATIASVATMISSISGIIANFSRKRSGEVFFGMMKEDQVVGNEFSKNAESINQFVNTILPAASTLIDNIKKNMTGMSSDEAQSAATAAGGLGSVLGAIGTLIGSLTSSMKNFRATVKNSAGTGKLGPLETEGAVKIVESFDSIAFGKFIKILGKNIKPLLDNMRDFITKTLEGIKTSITGIDPKQLEVLKPMAELIVAVMNMATSMYSSLGKIDFGGVGGALSLATTSIVVNVPSAADMLGKLAAVMPLLVSAIGASFDSFKPGPGFSGKVKSMKEAFEAVTNILKSIGEILPDVKDAAGVPVPSDTVAQGLMGKVQAMVRFLNNLISPGGNVMAPFSVVNDKSPMEALTAAIDALPAGPKADSIQKLKSFAESMTTLKSISDVMKDFNMPAGGASTGGGGGMFQSAIGGFGKAVAAGTIAMKIEAMKSMLESIGGEKGFKTLDEPIKNAASAVNITSAATLKDIQTNLGTYSEGFRAIPDSITKMADSFKNELLTSSVSGLSDSLTNFETEINKLATTRPHQIQAKLKETLGSLGIKGATYKIDAKPIALNLQLNVVMSAGDVANGIANQSTIIRSRIEQLATRSGVQNYDITQTIPSPIH